MNPGERKDAIQTLVIQSESPEVGTEVAATGTPSRRPAGEGDTVVNEPRIVSSDVANAELPAVMARGAPDTHSSRATYRPRLAHDNGTPTVWCALVGVVAPTLAVLSIIAVAISH